MNYRHAFHAGNFADVFKHIVLTRILAYQMRKDTPLFYLDTHAGIALYDLAEGDAARTGEWREGVARILRAPAPALVADLLAPWLEAAGPGDEQGMPAIWHGSPALAARLLRPQDRMILCELHPQDYRTLARALKGDERVRTVHIDGYTALKAYVPPKERRGLVLIDPPFEARSEFEDVTAALAAAWKKWPQGCYALWYPVKDQDLCDAFYAGLAQAGLRHVLRAELAVAQPQADGRLSANGLAIVNPPYVLQGELELIGPWLLQRLARGAGANWRLEQAIPQD
ncbi:MAG: 23S rRNA (adenine(2030)-N(6))-methyltransferase RlmJ [Alphaproteobacteria bacterium]|nr:23S rRNA (adenine(2030)-N(6))-methyltransferase RlmJ [Alphaproteobacteria bacterium]